MRSWQQLWTIWPNNTMVPYGWALRRVGDNFDEFQAVARDLRRLSVGTAAHVDDQGISDEEMSGVDPQGAYTAVKYVVSIIRQAAEEAKENPKVAELKDRLIKAFPRLHSGFANNNPPDRGKFWYDQDEAETEPEDLSSPGV